MAGSIRAARNETPERSCIVQGWATSPVTLTGAPWRIPEGMPAGLRQGHPVKVHGLVAQPWTMNDRSGVAFRAARIEAVVPQAKAS